MSTQLAELAVILALSAKPHRLTLHKSVHVDRNAVADAKTILRCANKLHRLGVLECNGIERYDAKIGRRIASLTEEDQAMITGAREKAQETIARVVADYYTEARLTDGNDKPCRVYFQPDPRGTPVRIAFKASIWTGGK